MNRQHVIGRLTVEVQSTDQSTAVEYRQALSLQVRSERFAHSLNELLNRIDDEKTVLQISNLELELNLEKEDQFIPAFLEAFQKNMWEQRMQSANKDVPVAQNAVAGALYFLEKGVFPWSVGSEQQDFIRSMLLVPESEAAAALIVELEQRSPTEQTALWLRWINTAGIASIRRLLALRYNFQEALLQALDALAEKAAATDRFYQNYRNNAKENVPAVKHVWLQAILYRKAQNLLKNTVLDAFPLSDAPVQLHSGNHPADEPGLAAPMDANRSKRERATSTLSVNPSALMEAVAGFGEEKPVEASVFIQNAGLVLVWQFLPVLFQRCGLLESREFVNEPARQMAVHLLQYIATGETEVWEDALLLNKILCGFPEETPISRFGDLDEHFYTEALGMLEEAIRQWKVLKSTSVAGLRETFLQREGKLTRYEQHWRLQVERKAVDVLLDRLPAGWGYSIIKLPWMPNMLFVEW